MAKKNLGLVFLCVAVGAAPASAQVTQAWAARHNGPGNGNDAGLAIAVDPAGNVYVTGESLGAGTGFDYATTKYAADGTPLWVAYYNGPANGDDTAWAIALDPAGNVYVTGQSAGAGTGYDFATIMYDTDGNQLWLSRYDGPIGASDRGYAIGLDAFGNVYVAGPSPGAPNDEDYATVKYDPAGNQLWVARYTGLVPGSIDVVWAMTVDPAGNTYVTGRSNPGNGDYATVMYDTNGNQLWAARFNGGGNSDDFARGVAVDVTGNVYVTGEARGAATGADFATIKYDSNGNQLWVRRFDGPNSAYDGAFAIAVDLAGNVHVTGPSRTGGTGFNLATVMYDTDGNELWTSSYIGPASRFDLGYAIALDALGNVYVTGPSRGGATGADYATIAYDSAGNQLWVMRYTGIAASSTDASWAVAVDLAGSVYVTGYSGAGATDYATVKYTQP